MAKTVNLIVLSAGENPPRFLLEKNRVWRDMGSVKSSNWSSLSQLRQETNQILTQLMDILQNQMPPPGWMPYPGYFCKRLYEPLVPWDVQKVLQQVADTAAPDEPPILRIHLDSTLDWVPWEIMYDGKSYLGLRFQIARLPLTRTGPDLSNPQPREVRYIYNLLGEHVLQLPLFTKWQTMFSTHINPKLHIKKTPISLNGTFPKQSDFTNAQDGDILHLTCHGVFDKQTGQMYWSLNHKKDIFPWFRIDTHQVSLLNLQASKPLVFGNACHSAAGGACHLIQGFGPLFFEHGALAFVGTFAPIRKELAIEFAHEFYDRLLAQRLSVAKALWATKKHYFDTGQRDPSWLFYCLYGPPDTRFHLVTSS